MDSVTLQQISAERGLAMTDLRARDIELIDVVVDSAETVADGVKAFVLKPATGAELPSWTPGSHIDIHLPSGLVRQYSLCGDPSDTGTFRIAVLREPTGRGGSDEVHAVLDRGTALRISLPRNAFELDDHQRYVFVAGGIGITPILPMIRQADAAGADWSLVYGGRSLDSMAFRDELASYGDRVTLLPQDRTGLIDLPAAIGESQPGTAVYCCGPAGLLDAIETHCATWPDGSLHTERFIAAQSGSTDGDSQFEVVLAKQDRSFTVEPGVSILKTLESGGVDVPSACQQGMCGTCEQIIVEGTPDHRDEILTDEERLAGQYILICVSRCHGDRLVLDL